jgi:hypothetical protein
MQGGADDNADGCDDDYTELHDLLAAETISRKRKTVMKGTQQIYDCYLRGFLRFCAAKGYTSENHRQVLSMSKEGLNLQDMMSLGIRPVACAQYMNEYMPQFITGGRKQNFRAHKKNNPSASDAQLEPASR